MRGGRAHVASQISAVRLEAFFFLAPSVKFGLWGKSKAVWGAGLGRKGNLCSLLEWLCQVIRICLWPLSRRGGASAGWKRLGGKPWLLWLQPRGVFHCSWLVGEVQMMLWLAGCKMGMTLLCLQAGSRNSVGSVRDLLAVLTLTSCYAHKCPYILYVLVWQRADIARDSR